MLSNIYNEIVRYMFFQLQKQNIINHLKYCPFLTHNTKKNFHDENHSTLLVYDFFQCFDVFVLQCVSYLCEQVIVRWGQVQKSERVRMKFPFDLFAVCCRVSLIESTTVRNCKVRRLISHGPTTPAYRPIIHQWPP